MEFDSQVYINKRALEFIVQEFNVLKGTKGSLKSVAERIIYLAQHKEDLQELFAEVLTEIGSFFEVMDESACRRRASDSERGERSAIQFCYLCLFDVG